MESIPKFVQGVFEFQAAGYEKPILLPGASYTVPPDRRSQLIYFRAGNSTDAMIYLALSRDGLIIRYFPIGAKSGEHIPLAVVEDLEPETSIQILVGAPAGSSGTVVLDLGLIEI